MILQIYCLYNEKYEETIFKVIYYLFPHLVRKTYYINLFYTIKSILFWKQLLLSTTSL